MTKLPGEEGKRAPQECQEQHLSDSITGVNTNDFPGGKCGNEPVTTRRGHQLCDRCAKQFDLLAASGILGSFGGRN